mmetsp:Transcript_24726/g.39859  ORF Transcript_24726/g.39859 Transcript_24726/m.39859 type:complete len:668 (-) Transcript_24726:422-2425(-)
MRARSKDGSLFANLSSQNKLSLLDEDGQKLHQVDLPILKRPSEKVSKIEFSRTTYSLLIYVNGEEEKDTSAKTKNKYSKLFSFDLETKKFDLLSKNASKAHENSSNDLNKAGQTTVSGVGSRKNGGSKLDSPSSAWGFHLIIAGFALAMATSTAYLLNNQVGNGGSKGSTTGIASSKILKTMTEVPILEWEPGLLEEAMRNNTPVIFTKNPAWDWDAMRQWNAPYLARHLQELSRVQVSDEPESDTYTYAVKTAPLAAIIDEKAYDSGFSPRTMSTVQFFNAIFNLSDPRWVYYAGSLEQSDGKKAGILLDVGDPKELGLASAAASTRRGYSSTTLERDGEVSLPTTSELIFVWMGKPGVKAHAHYDHVHNLFLQANGYKRWLFLPPDTFNDMSPYPYLHPRRGQIGMDLHKAIVEDEGRNIPTDILKRMMHTVVEPGDILYVPPLWTHHVTAYDSEQGFPISISLWVGSKSKEIVNSLLKKPIPVSSKWPLYLRWGATYGYLLTILAGFNDDGTPSICASRLQNNEIPRLSESCIDAAIANANRVRSSRYSRILPKGGVTEGTHKYICSANSAEGFVAVDPIGEEWEDFAKIDGESLKSLRESAVSAIRLIMELRPEERWIVLFDYFETTLLAAVGINNLYDAMKAIPLKCEIKHLTKTHAIPPGA